MKTNAFEDALNLMYQGLFRYALAHANRYESPIGEDGVLGDEWMKIASGIVGLLNGETGQIDCGSWDRQIRHLARDQGFSAAEADELRAS